MSLTGTYTALVTPFDASQAVDYAALERLVRRQAREGVAGVVPCGTTGESPTLSHSEHREVIAKTVEWAKSERADIQVIAGTGSNSTKEAIELTKAAAADGADYALVVNPYYNKPVQDGLIRHFEAIAEASSIPLVLYNIPGRTSVSLSLDTISKLARHPNIAGIKEATGDVGFMASVIQATPDDFALVSGDDNLLLPILAIGGTGVISVISNLLPKDTGDVVRKFHAGDFAGSKALYYKMLPLMGSMFVETNPIPVKYAMAKEGLLENVLRLPMTPLSDNGGDVVDSALKEYKNL